jgi:hypothetical protein
LLGINKTFERRSIWFKFKEDEDSNRRNTLGILSPLRADEFDPPSANLMLNNSSILAL